ncbi:hypothetical protein VSH64_14440 [Amycolatopsis rhabdoformis]|uniref:Mycobacterium membrane protein n=1 Tax=Amycolatopsis rhabdoformis TaxID=1448059 RepID=A0ABZ1IGQ3_9PSEU|nr:hypothetical protein [Amycolatopsis rhabdoformis]WSE33298.1 hypothetical protein VSH64_14440 [Amycolatopsis rhabdoformis]
MIKKALSAAVATAALLGLVACSNPTGKSWAISYEVTGEGTTTGITYSESVDRYQDDSSQHQLTGPLGLPWKQDVILSAGRDATVTATPTGTATLTCRILLDKQRELAKATSPAPGKPVTCSKTTDK